MTQRTTRPSRSRLLSFFNPSSARGKVLRQRPLFLESLEQRQLLAAGGITPPAAVTTDLQDYAPGSTATIMASNYKVGETIEFQVLHIDGVPNTGEGHDPWQVTDGSVQDLDGLRDGNVTTTWYVSPDDSGGSVFELTADGRNSNNYATATFTDSEIGNHIDGFDVWDPTSDSWTTGRTTGYAEGDTAQFLVEVDLDDASEADLVTGGANEEIFTMDIQLDLNRDSGGAFGFTELDYVTGDGVTIGEIVPKGEVNGYLVYTVSFTIDTTDPGYIYFGGVLAEPGAEYVTEYDVDGNPVTTGTVPVGKGASAVGGTFQARAGYGSKGKINFGGADIAPAPEIAVEKYTNSVDADSPTGPYVAVGSTVTWTYEVSNASTAPLYNVTVTDDAGTPGDPTDDLVPTYVGGDDGDDGILEEGETWIYEMTGPAIAGQYANLATVTGESRSGKETTATDPSHYFGSDPSIAVDKTSALTTDVDGDGVVDLGDTITYTYAVENTGNITLNGVTVVDDPLGPVTITDDGGDGVGVLAPGAVEYGTITYVVTQADVDAGVIVNDVVADSDESDPDTDTETVPIPQDPSISIDKSSFLMIDADGDGEIDLGDTIAYTYIVENTGNVTLTDVSVVDTPLGPVTITDDGFDGVGVLAPGAVEAGDLSHVVTQADIDAGQIANTVLATGYDPEGDPTTDVDDLILDVLQDPSISIDKSSFLTIDADGDGKISEGDTITYTYIVENTGNVTLTDVSVVDTPLGPVTITDDGVDGVGVLAPGAVEAGDLSHVVTQADVDAGQIVNTVLATGYDPNDDPTTDTDDLTVDILQDPSIDLVKSFLSNADEDSSGDVSLDDTLTYEFVVTNDGDVTLTNVTVVDPLTGLTSNIGTLLPGESATLTSTYIVTQANVDAGEILNTATATGTDPNDDPTNDTDDETVDILQDPSIDLVKTYLSNADEDLSGDVSLNDTLTYEFVVTNDGDVTLTNVTITDPLTGLDSNVGTLSPGESATLTSTYVVTQDNVNAGEVLNTATATGTDPNNDPTNDTDDETVDILQDPSIDLVKTYLSNADEDGSGTVSLGDTLTYQFEVLNDGDVTLYNVTITDPLTGLDTNIGTLSPGETEALTSTYVVTQDNVNAGEVLNTASVVGTDPNDDPVIDIDNEVVEVDQIPSIDLTKTYLSNADQDGSGDVSLGDTLTYQFVVWNNGTVTLDNVTVVDPLTGLNSDIGTLAPGVQLTITSTYIVTQANVEAGEILNTAVATGTDPNDDPVTDTDDETVDVPRYPSILVDKTSDLTIDADGNGEVSLGDTITYTYTVENTGNVTLTGVTVVDDPLGLVILSDSGNDGNSVIAPGVIESGTLTYVVTQADVDYGAILNDVVADSEESDPDEDDETVPVPQYPSIDVDKSSALTIDADGNGEVSLGDTITYTYTVTNDGNVTLTGVTVIDTPLGPVTLSDNGSDGDSVIAPGVTEVGTLTYVVTQIDVDAGSIFNHVVANSEESDPDGDDETVPVPQYPSILVDKTSALTIDADSNGEVSLGDTITYTYTVTNDGNVTLAGITVIDTPLGPVTLSDSGSDGDSVIAPGVTEVGTLTYVVTQIDVDAGIIANHVVADSDESDPDEDDETVPVPQHPAIDVDKSSALMIDADGNGEFSLGDTILYTYTVTNTGNMTLTGVTVVDDPLGLVALSDDDGDGIGTLAPEAVEVGTLTYVVTQADVEAGQILNDVLADSNESEPDTDTEIVTVPQYPELTVTKTADVAIVDEAGDVITYTFVVENTGNMILTDVIVVDPMLSNMNIPTPIAGDADSDGDVDLLIPTGTAAFTATYIVTQADIDSGSIPNTATATGSPSVGDDVTDDDTEIVDVLQLPSIDLVKTLLSNADEDGSGNVSLNDTLTYQFVVLNDGNVTLTSVMVTDPLTGLNTNVGTLAPGVKATLTDTYIVTQMDVDAGEILNTAVAMGTDPNNEPTTDDDDEIVAIPQFPAIDVEKATNGEDADLPTGPVIVVDDVVTWTYVVTNPGNVSLGNVTLVDDNGTPGIPGDDFNPTYVRGDTDDDGLLDVDETWRYEAFGIAIEGQYENAADVAAFGPQQQPVDDTDLSHYLGKRDVIIIGEDKGTDSQPYVMVIDADTGEVLSKFLAYEADYRGGVRIAVGDMNGDGIDEIITSPGRTHSAEVKVFTQEGVELTQFRTMAYDPSFTGGAQVAVGDVDGDGMLDIVTVPTDSAAAEVRVFRNIYDPNNPTADAIEDTPYRSFVVFDPNFIGGAVVEVADMGTFVNGATIDPLALDGVGEIIVGNGPGMRSAVYVYDASPSDPVIVRSFAPFDDSFRGGVAMDLERVNDDIIPDLIVGTGNLGASNVEVWDGLTTTKLSDFNAYTGTSRNAPVRVAGLDTNGDGIVEEIITAQGTDGQTREIRRFDALTGELLETIVESDPDFYGEYFVDTASADPALYSDTGPVGPQTVSLVGTSGNDTFSFAPGAQPNSWVVVLNGQSQEILARPLTLTFDGLGGEDTVSMMGTSGDDVATLLPTGGSLVGNNYSVAVTNSELTSAEGGGGYDTVSLYDSPGNDTFSGRPNSANLTGDGFSESADNFRIIHAYATSGGVDVSFVNDSPGDDEFISRTTYNKMIGDNFYVRTKFFEYTHAYARAGGHDTAQMFDSNDDDIYIGHPTWSRLTGGGISNRVKYFDSVEVIASEGRDLARFYDSPGSDTFVGYPTVASLTGTGFSNTLRQFDGVLASSQGADTGMDVATFYDSPGDDTFISTSTKAKIEGDGYDLWTQSFDAVLAYATAGGHDVAKMYGSAGDDFFIATSTESQISGDGFDNRVMYFEVVHAKGNGGTDEAELYGTSQDDDLEVQDDHVTMTTSGAADYLYHIFAFDSVKAEGAEGTNTSNVDPNAVDFLTLTGDWN